jgi:hypothetical protein
MKEFLAPVDLKLARAGMQAQSLATSVQAWVRKNPITGRCELREGRLGFRLIQNAFTERPPTEEWGLIVGECVHNLRSALDNLAYALARLREDPPPQPSKIAFHIVRDRTKFRSYSRGLDQLPTEAAALVEKIQPFQRDGSAANGLPDNDPLILLQQLNNSDKHRVPSVVLIAPTEITHSPAVEFYSEADAAANVPPDATIWAGPLSENVTLLEYRTKHPVARVMGRYEGTAIVALQTDSAPVQMDSHLAAIRQYTTLVVDQFRQFF